MNKLLGKLGAIQSALKAPKNQYNSFGGFAYRSCEDILEALKPLLREQGCSLVLSDEVVSIGDRYYISATATIYDTESGESFSNRAYAREAASKPKMDDSQVTGTASTYARKYALNGLFLIDDTKDADTDEYTKQQSAAVKCPKCGKTMEAQKGKGGKMVQPSDILKKCGGMCYECYQTEKNGGSIYTAPEDIGGSQ